MSSSCVRASAALVLAVAAPASAETLALVASVTGGDALGPLELHAMAQAELEHRLEASLAPLEQEGVRDALAARARCGSELACVRALVERAGAERALIIDVALDLELLTATLIDVRGAELAKVQRELGGATPAEAAPALIAEVLTRAAIPRAGRVLLELYPPDATLRVVGAPELERGVGAARAIKLAPGPQRLSFEREGFEPKVVELELAAGVDVPLSVRLEEERGLLASPWLWLGAAAAIAAGVSLGVVATSRDDCLCFTNGPECAGCD